MEDVRKEIKKELARIQELGSWSFNKEGEIAPDGFEFDFRGETRKEKNG